MTSYNNYYEFGVDKDCSCRIRPYPQGFSLDGKVDGLVGKPAEYRLDDLIKGSALEERIYRMRCVEGWSMVIPWIGFPLADLVKRVEPQGSAKYRGFRDRLSAQGNARPAIRIPCLGLALCEGLAA